MDPATLLRFVRQKRSLKGRIDVVPDQTSPISVIWEPELCMTPANLYIDIWTPVVEEEPGFVARPPLPKIVTFFIFIYFEYDSDVTYCERDSSFPNYS